jgi:transcriptional regulator with XRE-family HTH domain
MIGNRLKKYLEVKGISQADFARKTGLTQGHVSDIINNIKKHPSAGTLAKIDKNTDLNIRWLLTGEGEMFTNKKSTERSPMDIMRDVLKEEFDFTDKELSALEKLLVRKEVIILLTKALEGDSTAKELVKKIINQD